MAKRLETIDDFQRVTGAFRSTDRYRPPMLFAVGSKQLTKNGTLASARFPVVNGHRQNEGTAAVIMEVLDIEPKGVQTVTLTRQHISDMLNYFAPFEGDGNSHANIDALHAAYKICSSGRMFATLIFDDEEPQGVEDSTLKLYGLSNRLYKPNTLNLKKIFIRLPNVAWINDTPLDEDEISERILAAAFLNEPYAPYMVDKFPLYIHRINAIKMGVRITDQHKVRLGAPWAKARRSCRVPAT